MSDEQLKRGRSRRWNPIVRSGHFGQYVITREAVEGMYEQLRTSPIPINIEHDPTVPPVGRVVDAQLRELPNGELLLEGEEELFDSTTPALVLPVRDLLSALDDRPSFSPEAFPLSLSVDDRSYDPADVSQLREIVSTAGDAEIEPGMGRFSALPDALLVIGLGLPTAAVAWFMRGFFTKIGEAAGADAYDAFKRYARKMIEERRNPPDTAPITLMTFDLPRADGATITVEGSTRGVGDRLDAFFDGGRELFAVALAYAGRVPEPERLAKLHFKHDGRTWVFVYGLDDDAELVIVAVVTDEEYDRTLQELRDRSPEG